ncbi:hypothetical protein BRC81_04850 [Halobacteriales archaeon QS_1_68_20]|nr:MAG: hypothetical protein BRC81_04850 [Halobacteriales archaeon QS_1_68_20]
MTTLPEVLTDPDVEIVDLRTSLDDGSFERRRPAVESRRNRAVAGILRDGDGRLLLVRYRGADSFDGWRLPGSGVGEVTDFDGRLRAAVEADLGVSVASVTPRWVYRQVGVHGDETAPLFYVVCRITLDRGPAGRDLPTRENVEARWFESPPDDLVNTTVVRDRFGD